MRELMSMFKWHVVLVFAPFAIFILIMFLNVFTTVAIDRSLPFRLAVLVYVILWSVAGLTLVRVAVLNAKVYRQEGDARMRAYDELVRMRGRYVAVWVSAVAAMVLFVIIGVLTGDLS